MKKSKELRYMNLENWDNEVLHGLLYVTLMQAILAYLQVYINISYPTVYYGLGSWSSGFDPQNQVFVVSSY